MYFTTATLQVFTTQNSKRQIITCKISTNRSQTFNSTNSMYCWKRPSFTTRSRQRAPQHYQYLILLFTELFISFFTIVAVASIRAICGRFDFARSGLTCAEVRSVHIVINFETLWCQMNHACANSNVGSSLMLMADDEWNHDAIVQMKWMRMIIQKWNMVLNVENKICCPPENDLTFTRKHVCKILPIKQLSSLHGHWFCTFDLCLICLQNYNLYMYNVLFISGRFILRFHQNLIFYQNLKSKINMPTQFWKFF